jgi:hypothetical protein
MYQLYVKLQTEQKGWAHPTHNLTSLLLTCTLLPFLITVEPKGFQQATNQNGIAVNSFTAYLDHILMYFHPI